jgi:hypothetical protein
MKLLLILLTLLISCGKKEETKPTKDSLDQLSALFQQKTLEYIEVTKSHQANWPDDNECDGALWAGLAKRAGQSLSLKAALQEDGRPTRKPFIDCIVPTESKATTSNDMISGLILGFLYAKDFSSLKGMYNYGNSNKWIMGFPKEFVSRVYLRTNGQSLIARSIYALSKEDLPQRNFPLVYTPIADNDYPSHLQFIGMLIAKDLGDLSYSNELIVQETCQSNKEDAFANFICGDKAKATDLLLNPDYVYPPYVRGDQNYKLVHWLLAAKLVLE